MFISHQDDVIISKCIDIARSKGTLTSHDIAEEMRLAREPSNNPVIVDATKPQTESSMRQAIYKSMEWLRNYNRAFKKGEPTMLKTENYTIETAPTWSVTYEPSTTAAASTGFSFTLDNPTITKDIIDKLTIKTGDIVKRWDMNCDGTEDVINTELFTFKKKEKYEAPIRPLRYWQTDNGCITVEWTDHTKTTVTPSDPEHADVFSGICIAYTKKMFGSTTAIMRSIEQAKWLTDMPKRRKETERKYIKECHERQRKREAERREQAIQRRVENIKIEQEAQKRIAKEKEEGDNA